MSVDNEARDFPTRAEARDCPASQATHHEQAPHAGSPAPGEREMAVLVALADPTRRRLLDVLVEVGHASATTLANRLPVSRQAVVKHLQVLTSAGLVGGSRRGREVLYIARPGALHASARWLADLSAAWHTRLERTVPEGGPGTTVARADPR